jgi:hypothetical protein
MIRAAFINGREGLSTQPAGVKTLIFRGYFGATKVMP